MAFSMPSCNASSSLRLWIFHGSVALPSHSVADIQTYESTFFLYGPVVLLHMVVALDEASLISFSANPLMCNKGRKTTSQKTLVPKTKKYFLIQTKKETLLRP